MSLKPAIASMYLGRAWVHELPYKLVQAQANNFQGIELFFFEDLEYLARRQSGISANETPSTEAQIQAARTIKKLCDERHLEIICLQPFMHYEGLLDRQEHAARIGKLKVWFQLAKLLGTDIIQIPGNFLAKDKITDDLDVAVGDLQEVADMGLRETPVIIFAFENLCWSTYFDIWEKVWDLVERADRPNFGMCLDTFNIAGRVYADPASPSGKTPNADRDMKASLEALVNRVDVNKKFYLQIVDAEQMQSPLVEGHAFYSADQPARMSWSRNARLFAFEEGGYLPVMDVTKAIIEGLEYRGRVSMELFSRTMSEPGKEVPFNHAIRARLLGRDHWSKSQAGQCHNVIEVLFPDQQFVVFAFENYAVFLAYAFLCFQFSAPKICALVGEIASNTHPLVSLFTSKIAIPNLGRTCTWGTACGIGIVGKLRV